MVPEAASFKEAVGAGLGEKTVAVAGRVNVVAAVVVVYPGYVNMLPIALTQYEVSAQRLPQVLSTCGFRK